ncbi:MAG: hypothetical protein HWN68_00905 [Desulfobacterales bacterium]|nr:hypothetical protein [Desulfobacterales bacterium]
MKRFKIVPLFLMIILQAGCGTMDNAPHRNVLEDKRHVFIGTWEGKHVGRKEKLLRIWIQNRSEDGTCSIVFFHHTEEGLQKSTQKGKWWIEGNRFYEIAPDVMKEPDAYRFEILGENEIRFRSTVKDYEFIDKMGGAAEILTSSVTFRNCVLLCFGEAKDER